MDEICLLHNDKDKKNLHEKNSEKNSLNKSEANTATVRRLLNKHSHRYNGLGRPIIRFFPIRPLSMNGKDRNGYFYNTSYDSITRQCEATLAALVLALAPSTRLAGLSISDFLV